MTGLAPKRRGQAYRAAMAKWRRANPPKRDDRCSMRFSDGTRCPEKSAGEFGYCSGCWHGGGAVS